MHGGLGARWGGRWRWGRARCVRGGWEAGPGRVVRSWRKVEGMAMEVEQAMRLVRLAQVAPWLMGLGVVVVACGVALARWRAR